MELSLNQKKILITGGSKGIGAGIARMFKSEGAHVGVVARNEEYLKQIRDELGGAIYAGDLTEAHTREEIFQQFLNDFGGIDILINNAGGSAGGAALETPLEDFQAAMELNYYSAVHLSQLAGAEMKKQENGSIINISSIFGRESGGKVTYNNAKAALISFTKSFADEMVHHGVRVNGVAPGSILHPTGNWQKRLDADPDKINRFVEENIPAGRFGTVEEIANVVAFLASEKASWVVGATLNVDGGQSNMNF